MKRTRASLFATAAVATTLILSGCAAGSASGNGTNGFATTSSPSADATASFNDADVSFAQMMVPHHKQAVEMSDMLLGKDGVDQRVTELATQIKNAQQPEIDQLNGWLAQWGAAKTMSGMSHGDGMMSAKDMSALESAPGADAGKLFLTQMVVHHRGAIVMAQDEVDKGKNAGAQKMAANIVSTQTDEIARMQQILGTL